MSAPSDPSWRYGVALFPLPPLLSLVAIRGMWAFISQSTTESPTEADALLGIATFLVTALAHWLAVLLAAVVAVSAFLDARAFVGRDGWSPNEYAVGAVGLVHLAATQYQPLYLLSVSAFLYYVHRRRQRTDGTL